MDVLQAIDNFDKAVVNWFHVISQSNPLTPLMHFLTDQHNFIIPMVVIYIAMIIWGGRRGRIIAILLIPMLLLTDVFTDKVLKPLIGRARPFEPDSITSFPSSHATNTFGAATLFALGWVKRFWGRVVLYGYATLIAFTRVYIGKHHPTDVLAGAMIGILDALIIIYLFKLIRPHLARKSRLFREDVFAREPRSQLEVEP